MTITLERLMFSVLLWIAAIVGAYFVGHHNGSTEVQVLWDKDQAALMQANGELIAQHAIELQAVRDENKLTNQKTKLTYENAIQSKDADLAAARAESAKRGGLRIAGACPTGSGIATVAQANSSLRDYEAASGTIQLPEGIENGLWNLVGRADEVVEQARTCQMWVKENGFDIEK